MRLFRNRKDAKALSTLWFLSAFASLRFLRLYVNNSRLLKFDASLSRWDVARPEVGGQLVGVGLHAVPLEVLAYPLHIALKQGERLGVDVGVDRLREVDYLGLPVPIEDIVRGEVAVDDLVRQHQVYVLDEAVEERLGFALPQVDAY